MAVIDDLVSSGLSGTQATEVIAVGAGTGSDAALVSQGFSTTQATQILAAKEGDATEVELVQQGLFGTQATAIMEAVGSGPTPPPLPGVAYSVANGDWPAGFNGFSGGISWGGGFNLELDYSNSISPAAFSAFNALTTGSTIVITTANSETYYVTVTSATATDYGTTSSIFLNTPNPSGYGPSAPDIVIAINVY